MILQNESEYLPFKGYECHNACIVNCVNMKGIPISSSDIFFSATDTVMHYDEEKEDIIICSNRPFSNKYEVYTERGEWDNSKNPMELFGRISENTFVTIKICPEMLGYSDIFMTNRGVGHYINVLSVNDQQVLIADGYVSTPDGIPFSGYIEFDKLIAAWAEMDMRYKIVGGIQPEKMKNVKEDAKQNFLRYMHKHHLEVISEDISEPKGDILRHFKNFISKFEGDEKVDDEYCEAFLFNINVHGFMVVKTMIWEKMLEVYGKEGARYEEIYNKWKHILLCLRKYIYSNNYNKIKKIYSDVTMLIKKEDAFYWEFLSGESIES